MQITSGTGLPPYAEPAQVRPAQAAPAGGPAGPGRGAAEEPQYDQLTLSSEPRGAQRRRLELAGRLAQEVRAATTVGTVQALRRQVQRGEYQVDPAAIAAKMLLRGGVSWK